jgi:peptidoglycan pentaglycine glycine transferase (the first glycine)
MNEDAWDCALRRLGGNLLQSWRWGEFKERQGWTVHRLHEETPHAGWMAQVLIKRRGPISIAYVPCGPTLGGDHERAFPRMMAAIDDVCRHERALTLIMEPNQRFQLGGTYKARGLVAWLTPFQPRTTLAVQIADDETMLPRMHHKTRYHVRYAQRQGIVLAPQSVEPATIAAFHTLYAETMVRSGLTLLPLHYFTDLLHAFGDRAELVFALADGRPAAGTLLVRFGGEANYLFAGSTTKYRGQGAGAALVFRAMQWARDHGCRELDLGNIGSPGLLHFKSGFGGVARAFPTPMERRYRPFVSLAARRLLATMST